MRISVYICERNLHAKYHVISFIGITQKNADQPFPEQRIQTRAIVFILLHFSD